MVRTCKACHGKSYVKCPNCYKGRKYDWKGSSRKCENCNGSGIIRCPVCNGKGKLY